MVQHCRYTQVAFQHDTATFAESTVLFEVECSHSAPCFFHYCSLPKWQKVNCTLMCGMLFLKGK